MASVGEDESWVVVEEVMLVTLVSRAISVGGVSSLGSRAEGTGEQKTLLLYCSALNFVFPDLYCNFVLRKQCSVL